MYAMALREALNTAGNTTSEALSHLNPVCIPPASVFLLEALLLTPPAPLPGSLSSSSQTADAPDDNALTKSWSICSITQERPAASCRQHRCRCWALTTGLIKMDRSGSQILFLENRVKKFTKREVLEQNVEGEGPERHFILIYFIISLPWEIRFGCHCS